VEDFEVRHDALVAKAADAAMNPPIVHQVELHDRQWLRWGALAAIVGMVAWVVGVALIPLDAKLDKGERQLARVLADRAAQLYVAALLAVLGGVLLAAFFTALAHVTSRPKAGSGLLAVSLVGCVVTQTLVAVGGSFALVGVHAAVAGSDPALVALAWRGLWLTFLASAVPTVLFTACGVMGLQRASLSPGWVSSIAWISAGAHLVVLGTVAQRGVFALDGIVAALTPLTTVLWIVALAASLLRSLPSASGFGSRA
jgi:hypothetical protein